MRGAWQPLHPTVKLKTDRSVCLGCVEAETGNICDSPEIFAALTSVVSGSAARFWDESPQKIVSTGIPLGPRSGVVSMDRERSRGRRGFPLLPRGWGGRTSAVSGGGRRTWTARIRLPARFAYVYDAAAPGFPRLLASPRADPQPCISPRSVPRCQWRIECVQKVQILGGTGYPATSAPQMARYRTFWRSEKGQYGQSRLQRCSAWPQAYTRNGR